jgi:hypothetical protein
MTARPKLDTIQVIADYRSGLSTLAIGRKYQRSHTAILYRLRRAGVALRATGAPAGNRNARRSAQPHCTAAGCAGAIHALDLCFNCYCRDRYARRKQP